MFNLTEKTSRKFDLFIHSFEDLPIFLGLLILGLDIADQSAKAADVVREGDAAGKLNENDTKCFIRVSGYNVAETNGKHDGCSPILRPNIPIRPLIALNPL